MVVQITIVSPARTNSSTPLLSTISVSSCRATRTHAMLGINSIFCSISHISESVGLPNPHWFGAMESSSIFPLKNSSSVRNGNRSSFSSNIFLNVLNSIIIIILLSKFKFTTSLNNRQ